jgi:thiol-disulfide isomerase/thioredoxin
MKSKQTTSFIIFIIAIVLVFLGIGFLTNKEKSPGKLDDFAKALKTEGAMFYGAFWCPHCQEQKEQFGSSKKYLPYVECSNPDNSTTLACKEAKIESFPTWSFKNGISLESSVDPVVCSILPGNSNEDSICKNIASANYKTWLFKEYQFSVKSDAEPKKEANVWTFPDTARITGEVPLEFLAKQINYTLPE